MKLAFVFPGQGSQAVGMLNDMADLSVVKNTIIEASDALGLDLLAMMQNGPAEDLNLTVNTQPVMLTASVAFYRAWLEAGGAKPDIMAGHSLGEYSALTAANVLSLTDAVKLVRLRAQAMQNAVPVGVGGMAAVLGIVSAFVLLSGSFEEKFTTFIAGCGDANIIIMCSIYLLAGGFAAVCKAMGSLDSTVNLGLTHIPAAYLAAGIFIITAFP